MPLQVVVERKGPILEEPPPPEWVVLGTVLVFKVDVKNRCEKQRKFGFPGDPKSDQKSIQ